MNSFLFKTLAHHPLSEFSRAYCANLLLYTLLALICESLMMRSFIPNKSLQPKNGVRHRMSKTVYYTGIYDDYVSVIYNNV